MDLNEVLKFASEPRAHFIATLLSHFPYFSPHLEPDLQASKGADRLERTESLVGHILKRLTDLNEVLKLAKIAFSSSPCKLDRSFFLSQSSSSSRLIAPKRLKRPSSLASQVYG